MRSEPSLTGGQPPPTTPAIPGQHLQTPENAENTNTDKKIGALKTEIVLILKNTEWPSESAGAAEELLNAIDSSPDVSGDMARVTEELRSLIERYIQGLGDIRLRLKDASSKSEMKRWKFLQHIKSLASNRPSTCTLVLRTCRDDISKVINALKERMVDERVEDQDVEGTSELMSKDRIISMGQSGAGSLVQDPSTTGTADHEPRLDDPTNTSFVPNQSPSNTPKDSKDRSPISDQALAVARKTFKTVEIGSGAIPVVGGYVGAVAQLGLAFVEMLQTMDRNHSLAIELGDHTTKLNTLVGNFKGRTAPGQQDIASQINTLQKELVLVNGKLKEWGSLGQFRKAFSARDHAEMLKDYQERIQIAREEIQLLVGLDSRNIFVELENIELRKERHRLLNCLGDGQYGARGTTIQDIICFPGTRLGILGRIDDWIRDTSPSNPVLWMRGMAGRGKSTIASTVIHNWKSRASCAIFHFRRGQSPVNSRVLCALARQLASSLVPEVREAVLESVLENEGIAEPGRRLDEQFETLFAAPFAKLGTQNHPILIVIDALDEFDDPKDAVELVRLIHQYSPLFPTNAKLLLTCRPENAILRNLESKPWQKVDLDLAPDVDNDLARFLQHACHQIRQEHDLSEDWPSSGDIEQLVRMSQGLFQWARTVITYVGNGSPVDRLWALLKYPSAWSGLDELYHQILSKAFYGLKLDPVRQDILIKVLGTLVTAPHPVSLEIISTLYGRHRMFEGMRKDRIIPFLRKDVLADLSSLLLIPESPAEPMRLMHTSIRDLLSDEPRCKQQPFYVDPTHHHQHLATVCLEIMLGGLEENICNLSDLSKPASSIQDIVEREVSKGLQYCCQAWSAHLTRGVRWPTSTGSVPTTELVHFESFSMEKLMCWLEVMSLAGATMDAIVAAKQVHEWLLHRPTDVSEHKSLARLWGDFRRFIDTFLEPISFGPLHIYSSALPYCPSQTEIWSLYGKHAKIRIFHGDRMATWPSNVWTRSLDAHVKTIAFSPDGRILAVGSSDHTVRILDAQTGTAVGEPLTGHSDTVWSVSFSPDGNVLASASDDGTVRLWNSKTGVALGEPLSGHDSQVWCVCFSPIGKILASGSLDTTVRLWNTESGAPMGEPLEGHSDAVISVCFSSDGKLLASGSADETIRFWDPHTGAALGEPLAAHSIWVRSVCFCPNGSLVASGSDDKTVRLWAIETRTPVGEQLTGHNGTVYSVCFSPDGKLLASGSKDKTIRLWNTQTGAALGEPLTGHNAEVCAVCFSPDGKLLASGSDDKTVRLWDPQPGAAVAGSLVSHSAKVNSVCFSSDGKRVASVYDDHSIRLWDPQTGAAVGEPLTGHSSTVDSVCFSPDGKLLASGSGDGTIRLWDPQTGVQVDEPLRSHSRVRSVCFSPDGKYLASGSSDQTVRLWDPQTGEQVGEPFRGHEDWVQSVCFSPDGKYLASGSDDGMIRLWDPQTGAAVGEPLKGHSYTVISISFSSDGTLLLARCYDGSLATWDVTTRQRCDTARSHPSYGDPRFQDHWITLGTSRFLWLPPQYWDMKVHEWALRDGRLAACPNGSLSILDVSQVLGTLTYPF